MKAVIALATAIVLAATPAHAAPAQKPIKRPVVIGYLPTFKDYKATLDRTDLSRLTHINIAFVNPAPDASFVAGDTLACSEIDGGQLPVADLRDIVARAHKAKVKVLPSLGGGEIPGCSGDWVTLLSPAMRDTTVANLLKFVDDYRLDGIDIDLEWDVLTAIDQAGEYMPFVAALSEGLKKRGKLLTCATASNPGGMVPDASMPYFDYINIMSYDGVGIGRDGTTYGPPGGEHASIDMARHDIAVWQARGATKDQIVLGVPFYGKAFGTYRDSFHDYNRMLAAYGPQVAENDLVGQPCGGCSYITYNGRPTIRAKANLAAQLGAGVMIWELSADADGVNNLLEALTDSLAHPDFAAGAQPLP